MPFARILNLARFSTESKRFHSYVFGAEGQEGVSVCCVTCAKQDDGCVCTHLAREHGGGKAPVPMYWEFEPIEHYGTQAEKRVQAGDCHCHHEIPITTQGKTLKKALQRLSQKINEYHVCNPHDGSVEVLNNDQICELFEKYVSKPE